MTDRRERQIGQVKLDEHPPLLSRNHLAQSGVNGLRRSASSKGPSRIRDEGLIEIERRMPLHQPQTSIMLGPLYASPWNEDMHMPWPSIGPSA
jgi:hypothetical protein